MSKHKTPATLSEWLRVAIANSGLSVYAIAKGAGVEQAVIHRFMSSDRDIRRDIRMATADKLATFLGLELRKVGK